MTATPTPHAMRRRTGGISALVFLGLLVGVLGCSAPKLSDLGLEQLRANAQRLSPEQLTKQRSASARELFRDPSFEREDMQNEGVSCLAARLSFGNETYGRPLVQGLVDAINLHLDGKGVIHPNLVASDINTAGLAHDYAKMLTAYDKTNILDQKTLDKIASVSQIRYFAVPILVNFKEGGSNRVSVFGMRLVKTAWTTTRFQLQIWDGISGRIVWEGISDLTLAQEVILERPIRFEDVVFETWSSLVEHIPTRQALLMPDSSPETEQNTGQDNEGLFDTSASQDHAQSVSLAPTRLFSPQ